ncbi:MAG: hypothetical protein IJA47_02725 [Oscillospiraceae bacterium]|nr:hypothetical protein [Oscillospiraceae bacterium]
MEDMKITLDGKLDEAAWESAKTYTNYRRVKNEGGEICDVQTIFKILPCKDRIYFGIQCLEPEMDRIIEKDPTSGLWGSDHVELFISPSGGTYDYYQFITFFGRPQRANYYAEGGQICPDPYAPDWKSVVHKDKDFWSVEMEIPLTAFYMTGNDNMSDTWLINPTRCRTDPRIPRHYCLSSACALERSFTDFDRYLVVDGFPLRPAEDDLRIASAAIEMKSQDEKGYQGEMTVTVQSPVKATFRFACDHTEEKAVTLEAGKNEFVLPCFFEKLGRDRVSLELVRESDGKVFKRYYPVTVTYEPIRLQFVKPEYRCNFYPGQDYSQITGKVIANKPVTLKLEGPGIETTVITPDADGSFCFETPNFEIGEAWLTATIEGEEKRQKIRRLAPTGHTMAWISGGNLVIDGKPVLIRKMFSPNYRGGTYCTNQYVNGNFYQTQNLYGQQGTMMVDPVLTQILKMPKTEIFQDAMPSEKVLEYYDKLVDNNKDRDFVYYYLADEPECRGLSPIYLKHLYEHIAERDPYHVINIASRGARTYIECADWLEAHPYLLPETMEDGRHVHGRPAKTLGGFLDGVTKLNRPDKAMGYLPQAYCYGGIVQTADYLTVDEIICSSWAGMIHGGKSIRPYAFGDLFDRPQITEGYRYVFSSMEALEDFMLLGKREVLLRTDDAEAVLYEYNGEKAFVLVNFNMEPQTVTVDGISGSWYNFRHGGMITDNTFCLKPLEVVIGTTAVKDAGLPTYQEVTALVEKLEAERVAGSSKLVPLWRKLEYTSQGVSLFSRMKMFDGVRENLALLSHSSGERFVELGFTKVDVSFHKVVVSGWEVSDKNIALQFRNNGELEAPAIDHVELGDHSVAYYLKETISPDAMRLDFLAEGPMEIYEVEVF